MSAAGGPAHAQEVTTHRGPDLSGARPTHLYLVELRAAIGVPTDVVQMHHDLTAAITRLREGGVQVHHAGSVLLPADARYLCLVSATDGASVALACDAAGLTAAPVHEARRTHPFDPATHDGTPTTRSTS